MWSDFLNSTHMGTELFWDITQQAVAVSYCIWKKKIIFFFWLFLLDLHIPNLIETGREKNPSKLSIHFSLHLYIFVPN